MSTDLFEIVKYENILLFKGTKDSTDPLTTPSTFSKYSFNNNEFKWFTDDPHVAELYARNTGESVWVYYLKKPTYLIRLYQNNNTKVTSTSLEILNAIINKFAQDFINFNNHRITQSLISFDGMLPEKGNNINYLKLPFGLLTSDDQHKISKSRTIPPNSYIENNNGEEYYIKKQVFQRMSLHEIDKYLMVFLNRYKIEFLKEYFRYKNINSRENLKSIVGNDELIDIGINGYTATSWKSIWHGGNFHPEICLFQTGYKDVHTIDDKSSVVFVGRYIPHKGPNNTEFRQWITYDGQILPSDKQIPFVELQNKIGEIRNNCLGLTSPGFLMDTNGGGNLNKKNNNKLFKGGVNDTSDYVFRVPDPDNDTSDSVFGVPDPVPYSHYVKPLSEKEIDRILNSMFNQTKDLEVSMYGGKSSKKVQLKKKVIKSKKDKEINNQ